MGLEGHPEVIWSHILKSEGDSSFSHREPHPRDMGSHKLETYELHPLDMGNLILETGGGGHFLKTEVLHPLDMSSLYLETWVLRVILDSGDMRSHILQTKELRRLEMESLILDTWGAMSGDRVVSFFRHTRHMETFGEP
jgi:hypothetical protein